MIEAIKPTWKANPVVHAICTTRHGGVSVGPYLGLNLAAHVGDDEQAVRLNRRTLRQEFALPNEPVWLRQVHGTTLVAAHTAASEPIADACYTTAPGVVCAVMTADCLPILLCDHTGSIVVAIHAGWRGLIQGIISKTVQALSAPTRWLAWIGPGISARAYQVGAELREQFIAMDPDHAAFFQVRDHTIWADLAGLAHHQLLTAGVAVVDRYPGCTASEPDRFYSFRRDGLCGRMASLIWLA